MNVIEGKIKCMICKEEIEIKVKISDLDKTLKDKIMKYNNWTISDKNVNIICDECIDFVMKDTRGEC